MSDCQTHFCCWRLGHFVYFLLLLCSFMMRVNNRIHYGSMVVFVCLHFSFTTALSSLCKRIWKYGTSKIFARYILSNVCLRLSQFSQLSFMQYMGLCVFSLPISLMMILRIHVLVLVIIMKLEIWPICYCLWLGTCSVWHLQLATL